MKQSHFAWGNQLFREQRYEEAVEAYRKAIEQNPSFYWCYQNLGDALKNLGHLDESAESYDVATKFKQNDGAYLNRKCSNSLDRNIQLQNRNDHVIEQDIKVTHESAETATTHPIVDKAFKEAKSLEERDFFDEAVMVYAKLIKSNPNMAKAHNNLALILNKLGYKNEARIAYLRTKALDPNLIRSSEMSALGQSLFSKENELQSQITKDQDNYNSFSRNICLISYSDRQGGAAIAASRLHEGLIRIGASPTMLVREKVTDRDDVITLNVRQPEKQSTFITSQLFQNQILEKIIYQNRPNISNTMFDLPYPGLDLSSLKILRDCAVINLHWVSFIFSPQTLSNLKKLGKPIVWTLHDQEPMTGGCHYAAGCDGYQRSCLECPQLGQFGYGFSHSILEEKINAVKDIDLHIVCPSKWLADCARESIVFRNKPIYHIPYSLDTDIYKPENRRITRLQMGIENDTICFLFGAHGLDEQRKGFNLLISAIHKCLEEEDFRSAYETGKIKFLALGYPNNNNLKESGIAYTELGFVSDEQEIARIYSVADTLILPSIEDNYPNVMIEALSCGVPVIGFDIGGIRDLVGDHHLGLLVPELNSHLMAQAICKMYRNPEFREQLAKTARNFMKDTHSLEIQAKQYLHLYSDISKIPYEQLLNASGGSSRYEEVMDIYEDYTIGLDFWQNQSTEYESNFVSNLCLVSNQASQTVETTAKSFGRQPLYSFSTPIYFGRKGNYKTYGITTLRNKSSTESFLDSSPVEINLRFRAWRYNLKVHIFLFSKGYVEEWLDILCQGHIIGTLNCSQAGEHKQLFCIPPQYVIKCEKDNTYHLRFRLTKKTSTNYGATGLGIQTITVLDFPD